MKNYMIRNGSNNSPESYFQNIYDSFFQPLFFDENKYQMKTDIRETDDQYIMDIELPGFGKENLSIDYNAGYVTVKASKEEKEKSENYIVKERSQSYSRSYYVGYIDPEEIKAAYKDGVLTLNVPKEDARKNKKGIQID